MKRVLHGMAIAAALGVCLAAAVAVAEEAQPETVSPKTIWPNVVLPGDPLPEGVVPSPVLDYGEYFRTVTNFNDTSSSRCIGYPITPMCAVETHMAANLRDDEVLRAIAFGERPGPPEMFKDASTYNSAIHGYRVIAARQFVPYTVPYDDPADTSDEKRNIFGIELWDVAITMETNNCTYAPCTKAALNSDNSYLTRKGQYGWYVVGVTGYKYDITSQYENGYYRPPE
jgi:hypothetical protein